MLATTEGLCLTSVPVLLAAMSAAPREDAVAATSIPLLLAAAGTVGLLHSILPDHWVPLAVIARTQRWTVFRTVRTSLLASVGHVLTSIILGGIIAAVGLQFRAAFETQQGHIVGIILILTGAGFALWALTGRGGHHEHGHHHEHEHHHGHTHHHDDEGAAGVARFLGIAVPFGAAASPDLTILPVFLAASASGLGTVIGVLGVFSLVTLATFVVLTVGATLAGYQVKGEWLEKNGNTIAAVVLMAVGIAVYVGI